MTTLYTMTQFLENKENHLPTFKGSMEVFSTISRVLGQETMSNVLLQAPKGSGKTAALQAFAQLLDKIASKDKDNNTDHSQVIPDHLAGRICHFLDTKELLTESNADNIKKTLEGHFEALAKSKGILVLEDFDYLIPALYQINLGNLAIRLSQHLENGDFSTITTYSAPDDKESLKKAQKKIPHFDKLFTSLVLPKTPEEVVKEILISTEERFLEAKGRDVQIDEEALDEMMRLASKYDHDSYSHLSEPGRSQAIRDMVVTHLIVDSQEQGDQTLEAEIAEYETLLKESEAGLLSGELSGKAAEDFKNEKPEMEAELAEKKAKLLKQKSAIEVNVSSVQDAFEAITGLNVKPAGLEERKRIQNTENVLNSFVKGQDQAVNAVAKPLKKAAISKKKRTKPIATYLFIGPSGVGKTELCKGLASLMQDGLVRVNMGEYLDSTAANKLIGVSAGYAGYDDGGVLTNEVRKKPKSVVLLDELEKAHDKVYDTLLTVTDEGYLDDNKGNSVDFTDTIIIATSNYGIHEFNNTERSFEESCKIVRKKLMTPDCPFRNEFINRFTGVVFFNHLGQEIMYEIAQVNFEKQQAELREEGVVIEMSEESIKELVNQTYVPANGARAVKDMVTDSLENQALDLLNDYQVELMESPDYNEKDDHTLHLTAAFNSETLGLDLTKTTPNTEIKVANDEKPVKKKKAKALTANG